MSLGSASGFGNLLATRGEAPIAAEGAPIFLVAFFVNLATCCYGSVRQEKALGRSFLELEFLKLGVGGVFG